MSRHDAHVTRVFELAWLARTAGDHPFGALLVIDGHVVAEALNVVNTSSDITAHAETELVRLLERRGDLGLLAKGTVYASCEPCPMCVGAMFWAGAQHIVFGLSAARLTELATAPGTSPMHFNTTAAELGRSAEPQMHVEGPVREDEAAVAHLGYWFDAGPTAPA